MVPFEAIKAFADPSVQFSLQFETLAETPDDGRRRGREPTDKRPEPEAARTCSARSQARTSVPAARAAGGRIAEPAGEPTSRPDKAGGGEVVRLDRFRKK